MENHVFLGRVSRTHLLKSSEKKAISFVLLKRGSKTQMMGSDNSIGLQRHVSRSHKTLETVYNQGCYLGRRRVNFSSIFYPLSFRTKHNRTSLTKEGKKGEILLAI